MNINNKILMSLGLILIFFVSSMVSSKMVFRVQDLGQLLGLGGITLGYFGSKIFRK